MALTNVYISTPYREMLGGELNDNSFTTGLAATTTNFMELRIMTNDGSAVTNITRRDVIVFLEALERFLVDGGIYGTDANIPVF